MSQKWKKLDMIISAICDGKKVGLSTFQEGMLDFIKMNGILPISFSHFGVVVKNINSYIEWLSKVIEEITELNINKDQVASYNVYIARFKLDDIELELIEPYGESFFMEYLNEHGNCLHHISYQVRDIENSILKLSKSKDTVELIDLKPRSGSHGKVAFMKPVFSKPMCLELCQNQG